MFTTLCIVAVVAVIVLTRLRLRRMDAVHQLTLGGRVATRADNIAHNWSILFVLPDTEPEDCVELAKGELNFEHYGKRLTAHLQAILLIILISLTAINYSIPFFGEADPQVQLGVNITSVLLPLVFLFMLVTEVYSLKSEVRYQELQEANRQENERIRRCKEIA